jgi:lipopolysaccharide export system protein LptA
VTAFAAVLALVAAAGPALPPSTSPVRVDAAEIHYLFRSREAVFTGKPVTLTRDDAVLTCARLVAKNDEQGQIVTATCQGDVKLVRGDRTITCDSAVYENAAARVTCVGNTVLRDRGAEGRGERLVYELRDDEVKFTGKDGASVKFTLPGAEVEARRRELGQAPKAREGRP